MPRLFVRALLAFCASFATAIGQTPPAASAQPATTTAQGNGKPFTLEDAIALALRKNFDLQIQSFNVENAKDAIAIQEAAFDPTITASARRSLNQQASTTSRLDDVTGTTREPPRTDTTTMSVGATLPRIPATNGSLSVNTNISRVATNTPNALLNPNFGHGVSANLNQPLLAGAGRFNATSALQRAKLGLNIATINYKSRVLAVIADTENAYYNLVAARETLRIRQLTFQYNTKLFEENQARRSTGVATDLDVLSAEVGVATSRRGIIQAEQSVRDAEDRLLNLINVPDFEVRVGPVAFDDYRGGAPTFANSYKLAREYYPETLSIEEAIKQLQIDLETARRNQLPDLDLLASLGYTARATSAGYQQVIANLPNDHGNNWSIALNYSMPWGKHADKARYRTALTNLTSRKLQLEQLEQSLLVNVRSAVRAVETNLAAVEIAAKGTELAARQYDQQKARFDAGLSTSRQVLLTQDDLENARFAELNARLALRRAAAELNRLEGSSLERFRVQLPE
jgi:outer membrane protein TolC